MMRQIFIKTVFCCLLLSATTAAHAWYYDLTFKGTNASTTVTTVTVENLSRGTSMTLNGDEILRLTNALTNEPYGINNVSPGNSKMTIFPNPAIGQSILSFSQPNAGNVQLKIVEISGKVVAQKTVYSEAGDRRFTLPALNAGIYVVSVQGDNFVGNVKLISIASAYSGEITAWETVSAQSEISSKPALRSAELRAEGNIKAMLYEKGELLRITGKSGNYTTIIMKRATVSQDVEFYFVECTDKSGNHYPVVKIGNYYWMAENLRGAGTGVTKINSATDWQKLPNSAAAMAYYNFSDANATGRGGYYTHAGAAASMPDGWRFPTAGEIDATLKTLGGYDLAGDLLKAKGANIYWTDLSTGITGLDETSFRAMATGFLDFDGRFGDAVNAASFWIKGSNASRANYWQIRYRGPALIFNPSQTSIVKDGYSVRGIIDAPSPHKKIMDEHFKSALETKISDTKVLGETFVMSDGKKKIFLASTTTTGYARLDRIDTPPYFSSTTEIDLGNNLLKKMTAQTNAEGRQNLVLACWDAGPGRIDLTVYSDSVGNYRKIKSMSINGLRMPDASIKSAENFGYMAANGEQYEIPHNYNWMFQLTAGDVNGDGVDEIFVSVGWDLFVVDGKTFEVIMQRRFSISFSPNNQIPFLRTAIGDVDKDGKNDVVVAVSSPATGQIPQIHTFIGGNIESETGHYVQRSSVAADRLLNIAIGDVAGDGGNYLVCYGKGNNENYYARVTVKKYNPKNPDNSQFEDVSICETLINHCYSKMESLRLVRLRGAMFPCDIVVKNEILRFNGSGFDRPYGYYALTGSHIESVFGDQIISGNFDNNEEGKEQILYLKRKDANDAMEQVTYSCYASPHNDGAYMEHNDVYIWKSTVPYSIMTTYPALGAAGSNPGKTKVLQYKSHTLAFSEPQIQALMAAPPYYGDYVYPSGYVMGTSWGKSHITGTVSENASNYRGSIIAGFEEEQAAPVIGTKIAGVDFTTKLSMGSTVTASEQTVITKTVAYTGRDQDVVVLTLSPYTAYTYTIIKSDDSLQVGKDLIYAVPGAAYTARITLDDYESMTGNDPTVPNLRSIFKHTVGDPFTYPSDRSGIVSNVKDGKSFMYFGGNSPTDLESIGSGGDTDRRISVDKQMAESKSFDFEFETELVVSGFGIKVGGGFGFGGSNINTSVTGEGHTVSGVVPGLRSTGDRENFFWDLVWFNYTIGGQTFPVVYYIVKR